MKANSLTLNGGTLKDSDNNALNLSHSAIATAGTSHIVDTTAPTVKTNGLSITSTSVNNYYKRGATLQVTATFSENVNVTGTPTLTLTIGNANKKANYASGGGTPALVFEYTIVSGDTDTDGISIGANQLSGTITDLAGNAATLGHTALRAQASHKIDSIVPTVVTNGLSMTSTPNSGDTYEKDEKIQVQVSFSEKIAVSGTPQLTLKVGSEDKTADYTSGTRTTSLVFEYTVVAGDTDTDGISISANQLSGTIKDAAGNAATLTHAALPTQASHKVNGTTTDAPIDTTDPTVSSLAITSTGAPYSVGETIQIQVTFDEVVTVTGTPQLTLKVGSEDKTAEYASGSGTTALVFGYTVVSGDIDNNGVEVEANKLAHNGGSTIKDAANNGATLAHTALAAQSAHTVDTTVPTVSSVAITSSPPNNGTYKVGDTVQVTVSFSESVTVSGTPQVTLTIGNANKKASYASGTGTAALLFEYTVVTGDTDTDGISIAANTLALNGGTIKDAAGNAATLTHAAFPTQGGQGMAVAQSMAAAQGAFGGVPHSQGTSQASRYRVDGVSPTIPTNGIRISSTAPSGGFYKKDDTIEVQVSFSESVKVSGTPQVTLKIGTENKTAGYTGGTGTPSLVFAYTVVSGDTDTDGISIDALSGTIEDAAGNAAILTGASLSDQADHKVDTSVPGITSTPDSDNTDLTNTLLSTQTAHKVSTPPTHTANATPVQQGPSISSVSLTSTGPYGVWDNITVQVTTTKSVTVTGSPTVAIVIGNTEKPASYQSGSGSASLVFQYTVASTDGDDPNGISVKANSLMGGTIKDTSDNALNPNHSGLPDQGHTQRVDTTAPQVSAVAFTSTGPYSVGSTVHVTVTTSEAVTVTGSPSVTLVIGSTERTANYLSGTGTTALVFGYTLTTADTDDTEGMSLKADSLVLNSGTLIDTAGNALKLTHGSVAKSGDTQAIGVTVPDLNRSHASLPADTNPTVDTAQPTLTADTQQSVDTVQPVITAVAFATDAPTVYTAGSTVEILVTFAETGVKVTPDVSGTLPSLSLLFGTNADPDSQKQVVTASYKEARPGSTKLVFTYPVTTETPIDADGVQIQAGSLRIPSGAAITDANENAIAATPSEDGSSLVDIKPASRMSSRPILPSFTSGGIIFNEFLNAETDKHDWVELRNTTDTEISIGAWKLSISSGNTTQTEIVAFPDMTLPGGAVILLVNTGHKETHLEHSDAATYRYLKVPELRLRGTDFSLMLRDRSGAVVDVVSNSSENTEDPEAPTGFKRDAAYLREQPTMPGYEVSAWQPSGYQGGLGYNRKAAKSVSLGTPGYLHSAFIPQGKTAPVNISEIMFATGTTQRLPQWIELYNASKTEVVTLQGYQLQVEVADPMRQPMHRFMTFRIQRPLRILPNQTVLVVTKNGRNSQHFPEHRLYTLTEQNPETGAPLQPDADLLGDYGYAIVLRDASGTQIDIVGNLDGNGNTSDAPRWKLPNCMTANGHRSSIIRQYEAGGSSDGDPQKQLVPCDRDTAADCYLLRTSEGYWQSGVEERWSVTRPNSPVSVLSARSRAR